MISTSRVAERLFAMSADYRIASAVFLKVLALIYLAAFCSLSVQITGLVGENGILPFALMLENLFDNAGIRAMLFKPTLFWLSSSDFVLQGATYLGCVFALMLLVDYRPRLSLIAMFLLYLSLYHAGQTFLTFQWDTLLMEAGFLAIFLTAGPTRLLIFMFHWLLFRLRFMSGYSKIASGDPSWVNLTTLNYYFETQPLPHWGAWYFHQLPEFVLQAGVVLVLISELIVPFFIFLPRRFRIFAAIFTVCIQLLIIASSNHNWINLLTIALCLFLLDDRLLRRFLPESFCKHVLAASAEKSAGKANNALLSVSSVLILVTSVSVFLSLASPVKLPPMLEKSNALVRSWGIGHVFHVFPTMQTERHELQIEGSYDGKHWRSYDFKYKPDALDEAPAFIVPHQPRLDWMIWFVPPQHEEMMIWFDQFMYRLQQGSDDVIGLLAANPFPDGPPRYLRVQVFRYHFVTSEERARTGNWWKREYLGQFPFVEPRYP